MISGFVDFHTHLDWYENQNELLNQLSSFDGTLVSASVNHKSYEVNKSISEKSKALGYKCIIIPIVGIHPKEVLSEINNLKNYEQACKESPLIGEIGMDFCWYKEAEPKQQEKVFRYFLEQADFFGKYCVIHTKDAEEQVCRILEDYPNAKPIIHWYDGPEDIFQEFNKRGYYETFGCETRCSNHIQNLLKQTPTHLILAETDNPTAEPWLGGSDNSIYLIERIYADIAAVLNVSSKEIKEIIVQNSNKILNL